MSKPTKRRATLTLTSTPLDMAERAAPIIERAVNRLGFPAVVCIVLGFAWWHASSLARADAKEVHDSFAVELRLLRESINANTTAVNGLTLNLKSP